MPALRITGTNNVPLGPYRRPQSVPTVSASSAASTGLPTASTTNKPATAVKTKKSRWNSARSNQILDLLSLPAALTSPLTTEQLEAYAAHFRIKEITQNLQVHAIIPSHLARSPSPPPTYDNMGRRTNTREARYRKKLEDERHKLVEKAIKFIPKYKPPVDYKRQVKLQEKIYIPVNDYPEVNFIGLILGPRGKSLKEIEKNTGARIFIRGKGSVKEGKADRHHDNEEDLHCLVMADAEAKVDAGVAEIQGIIETAATTPEKENQRKQDQLRDHAIMNGTFRDDENRTCRICGERGHLKWDCPNRETSLSLENIVCRRCGQPGHLQRDCTTQATQVPSGLAGSGQFDQEYNELMAEIGFSKVIGVGDAAPAARRAQIEAAPTVAPWKKQSAAVVGPPPSSVSTHVVDSAAPAVNAFASSLPAWLTAFPSFPSCHQPLEPPPGLSTTNISNFLSLSFPDSPPPPALLTAQPPPPAYPPPPAHG